MPTSSALTVRSITTPGVRVPLKFTLGTSAAIVRSVPLLLTELLTEEGVSGLGYLFCYTPSGARAVAAHVGEAAELIAGKEAAPLNLAQFLSRRFALLGATGRVRMALSINRHRPLGRTGPISRSTPRVGAWSLTASDPSL